MTDRIPFFDFFDRFVPPRDLRLLLHDAAVETVRQLLMEEYHLRQVRITARSVKPGKKAKDILMGKPIKGKPIPMVDLNPKMGAVVLEGKVFAAELYETRRRGLWCLTFDMTDYRGSVTVRKYMEEAEAKPLDGAVKEGMWLRVQGIVELTRDGKDIQLRPLNITMFFRFPFLNAST